jgi:6-phospho-beta-glucosidase
VKLSIVGGAGVRVPLLINGVVGRDLPISHVALFDVDYARLDTIARLARMRTPGVSITVHSDVADCVRGADFVVTSIRVGGLAARQHDEHVALAHGLVGQETVGPGGFAMAVRTIPVLTGYVEAIARHAPSAWVINFTNPVGVVTQAMRRAADVRIIGICDTPTELFAEIGHALDVPAAECAFDYIGLNHLGWVREVYRAGRPLLEAIWDDDALLRRIYSRPLFPPEYLAALKLLPTEYVYYYEFPDRAVANVRNAGRGRGTVVHELTERLFVELHSGTTDAVRSYERYLAERSASYMQIESGQTSPNPPSPWADLTGYDRIAFDVMDAIVRNSQAVIPLNVPNRGNIPDLAADDVIEVPCVVGSNGPRALHVGGLPVPVRQLTVRVKAYERQTIEAIGTMSHDALSDALALNPLVPSLDMARTLVTELTL